MTTTISPQRREVCVLIASVFIVSTCTIFYELLISTLSSYLLGSTVLHFSLTIGLFLFFMGIGAYLSKFIDNNLLKIFILTEIGIGFVGGLSGVVLYGSYSVTEYFYLATLAQIGVISTLIGLEIPIVTRIVKDYGNLKDALANILSFDYLGALIASVLFPLVLLPYLGIMKTSFAVGIINLAIAFVNLWVFKKQITNLKKITVIAASCFAILVCGLIYSFSITSFFEKFIYQDPISYASQSKYQRIIVTQFKDDVRLFLNGSIQFSSIDEYRYHEPLVHIPMGLARNKENILLLGAGDGIAARELLKYKAVNSITIVDIDKELVDLARTHPALKKLNQEALDNPKVLAVYEDAFNFVKQDNHLYSVIIIDLPDPNDFSLGKLYSKEFYNLLSRRLTADGILVTQASSPYFAKEAYWCVHHTLEDIFPHVAAYSLYVPSFGQWGFHLASQYQIKPEKINIQVPTRFINNSILQSFFIFDPDISEVDTEINRLDNQALVGYYERSWSQWN